MVPKGWKLTTLDKVCNGDLKTGPFGSQLHAHEYTEEGVPVLMPRDLINYRANIETAAKISPERAAELAQHKLKKGDILFSRRGDVTRFALIDESSEGAICGTGCLKARPSSEHSSLFLSYFLQKNAIKKWLENSAVGQTMPNMNTTILSELPLMAASSKVEEEKIAKTLSTWDQSIVTTEKLLANSQRQKKVLMQFLLTGKQRLNGFSGIQWKEYRLGKLFNERIENNQLDLPLVSITREQGVIWRDDVGRKDTSSEDKTKYLRIYPGDIGYNTMRMWQGVSALSDIEGLVSPAYTVITPKHGVDGVFMSYLFKLPRTIHNFYRYSQGLTSDTWNLKFRHFKEITVTIPELEEQKRISKILQKCDEEIAGLIAMRDALVSEKKVLMQTLLTGKRRVKVDES